MSGTQPWPSREEWQAAAEYSVRTSCYAHQRVARGPKPYLSDDEIAELAALDVALAKATRPVVLRRIKELRKLLADWPEPATGTFYDWYDTLPENVQQALSELRSLEQVRTDLHRRSRGVIPVAHLQATPHRDVPADLIPDQAIADRESELLRKWASLRDAAAEAATEAAVAREIARRATDAGWRAELQRRASIDALFRRGNKAASA
jgi:hypothetical protein